jgi:N6-adenosine-specific RNA methylase IME4
MRRRSSSRCSENSPNAPWPWEPWGWREHSRKPEASYAIIERMYPDLPKLELSARHARPGWDVWGNEVQPIEAAE